jgi:protein-tyrosine phosphatase
MMARIEDAYLDDRSNELSEESRSLQQIGPEVVDEVDHETLDVRTIVVLIATTELR